MFSKLMQRFKKKRSEVPQTSPWTVVSGILLFIVLCSFYPFSGNAKTREHDWVWNVYVIPPVSGWDSPAGKSLKSTLMWHEAEIAESGSGVSGHDLRFVLLPPVSEDAAPTLPSPLDTRLMAIFSFASADVDRQLIDQMKKWRTPVPLFLAGGEDVLFYEKGRPVPFVFALDLFRDYRSKAYAEYAKSLLPKAYRITIMASRFTVNQEREAKICIASLLDDGFMPLPYWLDASTTNSFAMVSEEAKSAGDGVLISFVGEMAAKELWRGFMRIRSPWRIWYNGKPDSAFLSFKGLLFADQNIFLEEFGGFIDLKRKIWNTRALPISDLVIAGRAHALVHWLIQGINAVPGAVEHVNKTELLKQLRTVVSIPFGSQTLAVDPERHRPHTRDVYIAEIHDRKYRHVDTLNVHGLVYTPY